MYSPLARSVAALVAIIATVGCVPRGDYPSLTERPFEHARSEPMETAAVAPSLVAASPDPALVAHLADLERASVEADRAFGARVPETSRAVSAAGAAGSEGWIAAQQLVSALDALRSSDTAALGELDSTSRLLEASDDPRASAGLSAISAGVAVIRARDDSHLQTLEGLGRRLPS